MRTRHGFITIDERRFPVIEVTYHPLQNDAQIIEDYRQAFEEYARIAARRERLVYLLDMREISPLELTAAVRREGARIFGEYADRLRPVSIAEARVITSPVTRGVVTAFDWLTSTNKWPCRQFATKPEAEAWLNEQLASHHGRTLR